jgi:hypothetical protein
MKQEKPNGSQSGMPHTMWAWWMLFLDQLELGQVTSELASIPEETFNTAFQHGWEMNEEQALELVGKNRAGQD